MLVVGTLEQFYRPFLAYDGAGAEHTRRLPCPRQSRGDFRLDRIHQQATTDRGSRRNRCIEPINTHPRVADGCAGVTAGGLTDRLLSDYPNMFGDTSAGSGLNALTRDPDHAREFLARQQDKLLFGSDWDDTIGDGGKMSGRANTCGPSRAITKQSRGKKNSLRQCEQTVAPASLGESMSIRSPKEKEGSPLSRDNGGRMNIPAV